MLFLDYGGIEISIASDDAEDESWLEEFLCPPFAPAPRATLTVEVRIDSRRSSRWLSQGPHRDGERGDLFSLDGRFDSYPRWSGEKDLLCDQTHQIFFRWPEPHRLEIVASNSTPRDKRRLALLRAVRELVSMQAQVRGHLALHASAIAWRGRGLAFLGPRRAGKTTTLLACLQVPGASLITNDRLYLDPERLTITGMPTVLSVREGTLERLPQLAARLAAMGSFERRLGEEAGERAGPHQRLYLGPHQLSQALQVTRIGEVSLGALVFLVLTPELSSTEIVTLGPGALSSALEQNLLWAGGPRNQLSPPYWPALEKPALSSEAVARWHRSVRCQVWKLGPGCLTKAEQIPPLLEQALERPDPGQNACS
jgi:hypothetical protein